VGRAADEGRVAVNACKALWLPGHGIECQLPAGHASVHESDACREGGSEVEFHIWWDGPGWNGEEIDYTNVHEVEL
jgi:hypothetical protein